MSAPVCRCGRPASVLLDWWGRGDKRGQVRRTERVACARCADSQAFRLMAEGDPIVGFPVADPDGVLITGRRIA
jgi:hypothetical protein